MSWFDRLREAAYNSPSGVRLTFDYENVSRTFDKKTTAFEFSDADGTFVQDTGVTGRRYPLRVFFWGNDHDIEANEFVDAISERGPGRLEHPLYGTVDVVPFGTIKQRDDLKTAANQTIFELTFFDTIGLVYPTAQSDPASEVVVAVDEYNDAAAEEFEEVTSLDSAVEGATFKNDYNALKDSVTSGLQTVADTQADVTKQFNAINSSINEGIDLLIAQPLTLAFQTLQLIQAPSRALTAIQARLSAYGDLANALISGDGAVVSPGKGKSNEFHTKDLFASTYITGSVLSAVNNQFLTKTDALAAADVVLAQMDAVVNWRDDNFQSLGEIDTGGAYQQLQEAVALTAGFLVEISFSLKQERIITLDRDRTIIDLVAELYGSIDDQLDFFINSNNLSGSEILELPKGREIVFYL